MTYRERREARAERLRGWADKRVQVATATLEAGKPFTTDHAFNTQPGHIPFRARLIAREDRAHESLNKAASMSARADSIEKAADRAIYSDDENAVDALTARIADLEAQRASIKAYNASCRKGNPDTSLLTDAQRENLASIAKYAPYQVGKRGEMPSYASTNIGGRISADRERLGRLTGTYVQPGYVKCAECDHVKIIHGPKARPGCNECGTCSGYQAPIA